MIGEKLRQARQAQQLSLTQVASKAKISAATLSRIENEKQALDLDMLFVLARVLGAAPEELVGDNSNNSRRSGSERELAGQIASLRPQDRARLWRDLAATRRNGRGGSRKESTDLNARLEELLAQVDLLRQEIESARLRLKKR